MNKFIFFLLLPLLAFASSEPLEERVFSTIRNTEIVPGISPETLADLKGEITQNWMTLKEGGVVTTYGPDSDVRPVYVALQAMIEQSLAKELNTSIRNLKAFIHTPMPATPLCMEGYISPELIHPSLHQDEKRLSTVKTRATVIRDFLFQGGDLYVVYPKGGFEKRTEVQRTIYKKELEKHPDHLFDRPLKGDSIPDELIGATYLFEDFDGVQYIFSIQMTQANDPRAMANFGLWYGSLENTLVKERFEAVKKYLKENGENLPL